MTPDFIDPALAIPVALILWGIYILVRLMQSHREQVEHTARIAELHRVVAFHAAVGVWGNDPRGWPSEICDTLGVEL